MKKIIFINITIAIIFLLNCKQSYNNNHETEQNDSLKAESILYDLPIAIDVGLDKNYYLKLIRRVDSAIDLDSTIPSSYYTLSLLYSRLFNYDEAINTINKALKLDHNNFFYWKRKGMLYEINYGFDSAKAIYEYSLNVLDIKRKNNSQPIQDFVQKLEMMCLLNKKDSALISLRDYTSRGIGKKLMELDSLYFKNIINFDKIIYLKDE